MTKKLLIFGFGYCAEALISQLSNKDWEINVVSRNAEKITNLKKKGILACQWSDRKNVESYAINANSILLCVPPAGFGDPVKEEFSEFFYPSQKFVPNPNFFGWPDQSIGMC